MRRIARIDAYVILITVLTAAVMAAGYQSRAPFPGSLPVLSFISVCFLLDQTSTSLRVAASGSTSFVLHMTAGILFGGFWGGLIAGSATALNFLAKRKEFKKVVFNSSQRALCVSSAVLVYHQLARWEYSSRLSASY